MATNPTETQSTTMVEEAKAKPSYVDFEPYCAWHREDGSDTLAVHLHGFKKEQIKVQLNNKRVLKIEGERLYADDENTWARFSKQIKLPDDSDERRIRAKFSAGVLTVTMPKKLGQLNNASAKDQQQQAQQSNANDKEENIISNQMANQEAKNGLMDLELWKMAGKVAVVVLVVAISGAFVHSIFKRRSYNAEK